jgi:hypothetical protein
VWPLDFGGKPAIACHYVVLPSYQIFTDVNINAFHAYYSSNSIKMISALDSYFQKETL